MGLTHPFRGGISHHTTLLCRALRRRHEVAFYALSRQYPQLLFPGKTQLDVSKAALRAYHDPCLDSIDPTSWVRTFLKIRRRRPDLVLFSWWHPFFAPCFGTVARFARRSKLPVCYLCHNLLPHERSRVDPVLARYVFTAADAFIAQSRVDAERCRALAPCARVYHCPHPTYAIFAETTPPPSDARTRLGIATDAKVLLYFGYIRRYKGLRYLLEAMLELPPEERYHLVVVGEFYEGEETARPLLEVLRSRRQLTLVDRYVANEEIPLFFSAADIVVAPYVSATQSGVIQLAYSFDRPVITTRTGGIPESVVDGLTGYLVPPGDTPAIVRAVRAHFGHHDAEALRAAIRRKRAEHSWERMVATVEHAAEDLSAAEDNGVDNETGRA